MLMRKLIIIHGDGTDGIELDLMHNLTKADWQVFVARQFSQALQLLNSHDMTVGLIYLDEIDEISPELHEIVLANDQIEWIALAHPRSYQLPHIKQMVAELFHDYHTLPADQHRLLMTLGHAHGKAALRRQWINQRNTDNNPILGNATAIKQIINSLPKVASSNAPVLIYGESGSGKQLTARCIHQQSSRASQPFIAINCATLPASLIQNELFGSEQGNNIKVGQIEAANHGTLFINEIDTLPLEQQAQLLRFLQNNAIDRVGGSNSIRIDTRVIAASNIDLERAVREGRFREDLFYRINVLRIRIPALSDREGDIDVLARTFLEKLGKENRTKAKGFSQRAIFAMRAYQWPGNVRELINRIRNAIIMCESRLISPADLGLEESVISHSSKKLDHARNQTEHELIRATLRHNGNNVSQSAKQLGISRATLYRLISKFPENQKSKNN